MAHQHPLPRYFFLSYARGDDNDSIERFYTDLSAEVRSHAGLAPNTEVGFVDVHSMELGVQWSSRLMRDLVECRVFVALVSPRYLRSEMCGKEWSVFAGRLDNHTAPEGEPPAALLPLLWLPPPALPPVVEALQYRNDLLPRAYGDKGLRQMIRLNKFRDNYVEFVDSLARQIVRTAEADHVPPARRSLTFQDVRSVFHRTPAVGAAPPEPDPDETRSASTDTTWPACADDAARTWFMPPDPFPAVGPNSGVGSSANSGPNSGPNSGEPVSPPATLPCEPIVGPIQAPTPRAADSPVSRAPDTTVPRQAGSSAWQPPDRGELPPVPDLAGQTVCFVVAAPSLADVETGTLASFGRDTRFYGQTPVEWTPYLPELTISLASFAQGIAEQCQFDSVAIDVSSLPQAMALARDANQTVILLVDLWATTLEGARRLLRFYDQPDGEQAGPPTAVMVPASASDPHTQAQRHDLNRSLRSVFENRMISLDEVMFRTSILSHRAFDADLQVVLEKVRNRGFRTRVLHHRPPGTPGDRPILQGP